MKHHIKPHAPNLVVDNRTDLDELVPSGGDDDWVLWVWAEANAGNPLGVTLLGDGELAVTKGVPELDGAVTGTRDNLSVVGGERDREDIVGVADESAGGGAGRKLPEAEGLIPGGRESVSTIGGDNLSISQSPILALLFYPSSCKRTQSETMWE